MTPDESVRRKKRWEAFWQEPEGLRDMIKTIEATYLQRIIDADPRQVAIIANMKIAHKVVTEFEQLVLTVIAEGKVAEAANSNAERIAAIPDHKRRWL